MSNFVGGLTQLQKSEPVIEPRFVTFMPTWIVGKRVRSKAEMPKSFTKDKSRILIHKSSKVIFTDFKTVSARAICLDL